MAQQTDVLIDERIDIEGAQRVEHETGIGKQHLGPSEKRLAIMLGEVEGMPELDRLVLTDKRTVFYSSNNLKNAVPFEYGQIEAVDGKTGEILTHLGKINLSARGTRITFRNMLQEYVAGTVDRISKASRKV